jgi:hypothetical protein
VSLPPDENPFAVKINNNNNSNNNLIQFLYLRACQQQIAYDRHALCIHIKSNSKTNTK